MSNYRRRVLALEQAARIVNVEERIDREIEGMRASIESYAAELDMTPEAFAEEIRAGARRQAEIGEDAYLQELADVMQVSVEDLRDPDTMRHHMEQMERDWDEYQERRRAEQAQTIHHRAGVAYNGLGERVPEFDQ